MDTLELTWHAWSEGAGAYRLDAHGAHPIPPTPDFSAESAWAFATSGSSGRARWIVHQRAGLIASAQAVNAHLNVSATSHWGLLLPVWHVGGFSVLTRAHTADCRWSAWRQKWQAQAARDWLEQEQITHASLVPTQVHDLVQQHCPAPPALQAIVVGGGHLSQATGQAARDLGWPVLASYGMTEAASQIATQPLESRHQPFATVPLMILPHWQTRCDSGHRLSIRGPSLFSGELLARADGTWQWQARGDAWHATQDRVELSPAGQLRVLGRSDFIVKILGELVDPLALESQLVALGLPESHIALIAVPDARREHALCLCHEATAVSTATIAEALQRYHQHCAGHLRITQSAACSAFPRSDLGKIRREPLRVQVLERGTQPVG